MDEENASCFTRHIHPEAESPGAASISEFRQRKLSFCHTCNRVGIVLNSLTDEEDWIEVEPFLVAAGGQLLVSLSSGDGWVDELVDISGGRNIEEDGFPGASGVIEDLLLILRDIIAIQEVVISEVVVFVGRGDEACSHLQQHLFRNGSVEESELFEASLGRALPHQDYLFKLISRTEAVIRTSKWSGGETDMG